MGKQDIIIPGLTVLLIFVFYVYFSWKLHMGRKGTKKAVKATNRWHNLSKAVREYSGDKTSAEFQGLLQKQKEALIEFLETHPYCIKNRRKDLESFLPKLETKNKNYYKRAKNLLDSKYS